MFKPILRIIAPGAGLAAILLLVAGAPAAAQATTSADAVAPVEEFSREVENLKKTFSDLNQRITDSVKSIEGLQSGETSRSEIEQLRDVVGKLLGAVADNGTVSQLGAKALAHARAKLKSLQQETRFTPEQRQFLTQEWSKLTTEIESATGELEAARGRFAGLLRTLQTTDDYVGELIEIRQGKEALKVIKGLAKEIHDASNVLNNFIKSIEPPRPGT